VYEAFFSLEDTPFVLTPDPRFLLRSRGHHEVLSSLLYGITSQKGLMALIGDVGTGKTLLCRALLRELPKDVQSALVLNPYLTDTELLGTILDDLGVDRRGGTTKGELMSALSQHLLAVGAEGKTVVVILDEAQQMSAAALEQIRILSTLETATRKLLQIVLVGQPELEEVLRRRDLRQLDQRIGIRCYLKPLSRKETFRYVEHRLRIAGLAGAVPFSRGALAQVYRHSRGIPRVINLVCDRALTAAFSARAREVTPALVKVAIRNLEGERPRRRMRVPLPAPATLRTAGRLAAGVAGVALVGVAATAVYRGGWMPSMPQLQARPATLTPAAQEVSEPVVRTAARAMTPVAPVSAGAPGRAEPNRADQGASGDAQLPADDGARAVLARALRLWGVSDDLSELAMRAWPLTPEGALDVPAIAARYQLAATRLPETTLDELRAMDLPALVELAGQPAARPVLLRRLDNVSAAFVAPSGAETRLSLDELDAAWTHAAWLVWRNVDLLPVDPNQDLNPIVVATLSLRLQKLGLIEPPVPTSNSDRFRTAVRRFQESMGLAPDGIVGPRTTLALSRVVAGRFGPNLGNTSR
jgi:general secretion pathway protein A